MNFTNDIDLQSHILRDIPDIIIGQIIMRKIPLNKRSFRIFLSKMIVYAIVQKI